LNGFCTVDPDCQPAICDLVLGCVNQVADCSANMTNCTTTACIPGSGCSAAPVVCDASLNYTDPKGVIVAPGDCDLFVCDLLVDACAILGNPCEEPLPLPTEVIIATTLSIAAVIGIIIGVVAAVLCCVGGAVAYRYRDWDHGDDAPVQSNPLYEGSKGKHDNPLFDPVGPDDQ
jgi:hypothetical protein